MNFLLEPVRTVAVAIPKQPGKGIPVKVPGNTYEDLRAVARVTDKDISEVLAELLRAPLALRLKKLGPEIESLRKMDEAKRQLAEKAREKVGE